MIERTYVDHNVTVAASVATLTFTRAAAYNSLTIDLLESLLTTLRVIEADNAIRALVIAGSVKAFCSGQALNDPRFPMGGSERDFRGPVEAYYNPIIRAMLASDKPMIAAITGVVAGAGLGLALACDFRVAGSGATFTTAFANIGLVPDSGVSFLLPRIVGYGRAVELCVLADRIDANRAEAIGLVTRVVADDAVLAEAHELASRLARGPRSIGYIKREMVENGLAGFDEALGREASYQFLAGRTSDFDEGLTAFFAKRPPAFRGT